MNFSRLPEIEFHQHQCRVCENYEVVDDTCLAYSEYSDSGRLVKAIFRDSSVADCERFYQKTVLSSAGDQSPSGDMVAERNDEVVLDSIRAAGSSKPSFRPLQCHSCSAFDKAEHRCRAFAADGPDGPSAAEFEGSSKDNCSNYSTKLARFSNPGAALGRFKPIWVILASALMLMAYLGWSAVTRPQEFRGKFEEVYSYLASASSPDVPGQLWKFKTGDVVGSSPAVGYGNVFIGSGDGNLYAINQITGKLVWKFETGDMVESSPYVTNNAVFVGSFDGWLYAVGASDGELYWEFDAAGDIMSSPTVSEGVVYVGSGDHNLYALEESSGKKRWSFKTGSKIEASPVVSEGVVYIGSNDDHLYSLDARTGRLKWKFETGDDIFSTPLISGRTVFVGSIDGFLYALDIETGKERWRFETGDIIATTPAISKGVVFAASGDGHLYAVDASTGKQKWKFPAAFVDSSPRVWEGYVYLGTGDGSVYAVNAVTGKGREMLNIGEPIVSTPFITDGVVYFGGDDHNVYAVKALDVAGAGN